MRTRWSGWIANYSALGALFFLASCVARTPGAGNSGPPDNAPTQEAAVETPSRMVPEIIAHRGASHEAPENTLAAFRLAGEHGVDFVELDCMLSADGRVVVIHDPTVDRTTDGSGRVDMLEYAQLRTLDAGSWKDARFSGERIPLLSDVLDAMRDLAGVYVEIKGRRDDGATLESLRAAAGPGELAQTLKGDSSPNARLARAVLEELQASTPREVVVQSFSPLICAVAASGRPDLRVELLFGGAREEEWTDALAWGRQLGLSGLNCHHAGLSQERLALAHEAGFTVAVWTVDAEDDLRMLAGLGVDGIITNRPEQTLRTVRELGLRSP